MTNMNKNTVDIAKYWLNGSSMAQSLGITRSAFSAYSIRPVHETSSEKFYTVGDVVNHLMSRQEDKQIEQLAKLDSGDLYEQQCRLTKARADKLELENQLARKKVAPVEDISAMVVHISKSAVAILDSMRGTIRRANPTMSNTMLDSVMKIVARARNSIADMPLYEE